MDIVKIFATALTLCGMFLLIFTCFAFMKGGGALLGIPVDTIGLFAPFILGIIFFGAGLFLFRFLVSSTKSTSRSRND